MKVSRRHFLRIGAVGGAVLLAPCGLIPKAWATSLVPGVLLDPESQPLFAAEVPNALNPAFKYMPDGQRQYEVGMYKITHDMGLKDPNSGQPLLTDMYGYGQNGLATYPGKTFEEESGKRTIVRWMNYLPKGEEHILPVDTSLHWCYSLHGYENFTIKNDGVPVVPHVHGGHTESASDGLPEYFFTPDFAVVGPRWQKENYRYDNDQEAGTVWYHDHALGITRLNVYAGLAGFFIIRDDRDTGKPDNPIGLPAFPYEAAFAIQDKMFREDGSLFFPAFPGDPAYDDFITGEGAILPEDKFPGGGPTALAEFFGDHIVVNGKIWPKMTVEPRQYRIRLLNGCDSRFLICQLKAVDMKRDDPDKGDPVAFYQIGTDDGLLAHPVALNRVIMGPGERIDLVIDFSAPALKGKRVILENIGPDAPFGGFPLAKEDFYKKRRTNRIMAFEVTKPLDQFIPDTSIDTSTQLRPGGMPFAIQEPAVRTRKLALFEGKDEYGRLQPLLGVIDPSLSENEAQNIEQATDGALGWFQEYTENPDMNDVEIWEVYNATMDAHPIHVHLVTFEILNRQDLGEMGTYWDIEERPQPQHNSVFGDYSTYGVAGNLKLLIGDGTIGPPIPPLPNERGPKDTVQMYPGQVTRIKMKFDRPGRFVWHCHILSHEDHEMMRPYFVGMLPVEEMLAIQTQAVPAQVFPNPFTEQVQIRVELAESSRMEVRLFDLSGKLLQSLGRGDYASGSHFFQWNGTMSSGLTVSPGSYVYQVLINGRLGATGKLLKL